MKCSKPYSFPCRTGERRVQAPSAIRDPASWAGATSPLGAPRGGPADFTPDLRYTRYVVPTHEGMLDSKWPVGRDGRAVLAWLSTAPVMRSAVERALGMDMPRPCQRSGRFLPGPPQTCTRPSPQSITDALGIAACLPKVLLHFERPTPNRRLRPTVIVDSSAHPLSASPSPQFTIARDVPLHRKPSRHA